MRTVVDGWVELAEQISEKNGVMFTNMEHLREIHGVARLGVRVLQEITLHLALLGIGHIPANLPSHSDLGVILYDYAAPAGELLAGQA